MTIAFPDVLCLDRSRISLVGNTVSINDAIQGACDNPITITTSVDSIYIVEKRLAALDDHDIASEALTLVDARFRSIPSLQEIIVDVDEYAPCKHIRKRMESHGWVLRTTECGMDESCGDFGVFILDFGFILGY